MAYLDYGVQRMSVISEKYREIDSLKDQLKEKNSLIEELKEENLFLRKQLLLLQNKLEEYQESEDGERWMI